ncbi:MAG: DUF1361 domain-containing protein [Flavobacteriales bacterium]|nr:DUF1361 domain-containing protein [Flavobacteriales bacterium]
MQIKKLTSRELMLTLGGLTSIALLILLIRINLTRELRYTFLVWNLFLAYVPLMIVYLIPDSIEFKWKEWILLLSWLLFFPNAPYIVTDFIHLKYSFSWFDVFLISSFAILGLIAGYQSYMILESRFSNQLFSRLNRFNGFFFLTALGVYLGRIKRWNSWDIFHDPKGILKDALELIVYPKQYVIVWLFILISTMLLALGYAVYKRLISLIYEEQ